MTQINGLWRNSAQIAGTMHVSSLHSRRWTKAALAIAAALLVAATPTRAAHAEDTELGPVFLLSLGGKLYDNAWRILDLSTPEGRNPALADAPSVPRRDTWRCVTCHGWDYTGTEHDGIAFPGLDKLADATPEAIKERLLDAEHPFPSDLLPELALELLSLFISTGQYERSAFLNDAGEAIGNPEFGRDIFEGACMSCHQLDGRMFLRGERGDRPSLGWVARNRPEQALHKIVNGVPAAEMLSLRFLSEGQIADLLAYVQTLEPAEQ